MTINSQSHVLVDICVDLYWLNGNGLCDDHLSSTIVLAMP
jgi:hypothetical protein